MSIHEADEILILGAAHRVDEAGLRLSRIGFDRAVGFVANAEVAFVELDDLVETSNRATVAQIPGLEAGTVILDVRNPGEREGGAIPGSVHIPLAELSRRHHELPADRPVLVHCASGWRSSVGASLLRAEGHSEVSDLVGGYDAWIERTGVTRRR